MSFSRRMDFQEVICRYAREMYQDNTYLDVTNIYFALLRFTICNCRFFPCCQSIKWSEICSKPSLNDDWSTSRHSCLRTIASLVSLIFSSVPCNLSYNTARATYGINHILTSSAPRIFWNWILRTNILTQPHQGIDRIDSEKNSTDEFQSGDVSRNCVVVCSRFRCFEAYSEHSVTDNKSEDNLEGDFGALIFTTFTEPIQAQPLHQLSHAD